MWLATLLEFYNYDWVGAEREFRRAIELAPGYALAHSGYGLMLFFETRFDEAERELKLAQLLDPLQPFSYQVMGSLLSVRGDSPKALEQCRKAAEVGPDDWPTYAYCFGSSYDRMGNHGQALNALEKAVAIAPFPIPIALLGKEYARSGNRQQARKVIEQLNHLPAQMYVAPCCPAWVYLALGENNTALELLEKSYQERSGCLIYSKVDEGYDQLRSDPRFIELMKKVGLDK